MKTFKVGKKYKPYQTDFAPAKIIRRTEKTIFCEDVNGIKFSMRVHKDANGNEYAVDCSVPKAWRDAYTYEA
jgi:hypothetical protein